MARDVHCVRGASRLWTASAGPPAHTKPTVRMAPCRVPRRPAVRPDHLLLGGAPRRLSMLRGALGDHPDRHPGVGWLLPPPLVRSRDGLLFYVDAPGCQS